MNKISEETIYSVYSIICIILTVIYFYIEEIEWTFDTLIENIFMALFVYVISAIIVALVYLIIICSIAFIMSLFIKK